MVPLKIKAKGLERKGTTGLGGIEVEATRDETLLVVLVSVSVGAVIEVELESDVLDRANEG